MNMNGDLIESIPCGLAPVLQADMHARLWQTGF